MVGQIPGISSSSKVDEGVRPLRSSSAATAHGSISACSSRPATALTSHCLLEDPGCVGGPGQRHLDSIERLMAGDQYFGRGCRQRRLEKSQFCNPYKVGEYSRVNATRMFEKCLERTAELIRQVPSLTGKRLVCHCTLSQSCLADAPIRKFRELYPSAYDRNDPTQRAPTADELNLLARHRQEPPGGRGFLS